MEKLCLACGACPSRKDTRYLSGVTGAHLLPLFNKLVELSFTDPVDIQRFLQYCSSTTGILVCKKCFRQLERLTNIAKEQEQIKSFIQGGIKKVGQHFGIVASTSRISTPVKRVSEDHQKRSCKKRRLNYDTPEKEALAKIVNPKTLVVSVSVFFLSM